MLSEHFLGSVANHDFGPNAVLPTNGGAGWSSPLGVVMFLKSATVAPVPSAAYGELAAHGFASYQEVDAHAKPVSSAGS